MELSRDQEQNISHQAVMDEGAFLEAEHEGCPACSRVHGGGDLLVGRGPMPTPVGKVESLGFSQTPRIGTVICPVEFMASSFSCNSVICRRQVGFSHSGLQYKNN